MNSSWKTLEDSVRAIASIKWNTSAVAEHLGGVDFDAVLRPDSEEIILIEITKRQDLGKVRDDIIKINSYRLQMLADGVMVRGYVIIEDGPTLSMIETGKQNKVKVMSAQDFLNDFFKCDAYIAARLRGAFGSAINPITGLPDHVQYVPVDYTRDDNGETLGIQEIANSLSDGNRVILIGDYGTGKSRATQNIFSRLSEENRVVGKQVFAINLREHWGATTASEIIAGHLEELGFSGAIDNAMQIIRTGGAILLLDGVDEVGAQTFGANRESRKSVRKAALEGVRKLIKANKGGVFLTSRSHYFDSDEEMIDALGLGLGAGPVILRSQEEFSVSEANAYLREIELPSTVPQWLPRKPLIFQVLSTIAPAAAIGLLAAEDGEFAFWDKFLTTVAEREANIHGSLKAEAVRQILIKLASITREGDSYLGRLSVRNVREAYEHAIQDTPDQAGEQMLMRLCMLGRVAPESPERQFVDSYIVDGLRAEDLTQIIDVGDKSALDKKWRQPLSRFGWGLIFSRLLNQDKEGSYRHSLASFMRGDNDQASAEILSTLLAAGGSDLQINAASLKDVDIYSLQIGQRRLSSLVINNSYIQNLELVAEPENSKSEIRLNDCQILDVYGVTTEEGLPKWIKNSEIERYESLSTSNRIMKSDLSAVHRLFLSVIHKIFFQPGQGRDERALLKGGYGQYYENKLLQKILNILLREALVVRKTGRDGYVYEPIRKQTVRMARIKGQLALCGDPLWSEIGELQKDS
jgi:hypothetical protein